MSALSFASILLTLASLFGFINHRFLRLPNPVGLERFQSDWKRSNSNFAGNFIGLTPFRNFQSA